MYDVHYFHRIRVNIVLYKALLNLSGSELILVLKVSHKLAKMTSPLLVEASKHVSKLITVSSFEQTAEVMVNFFLVLFWDTGIHFFFSKSCRAKSNFKKIHISRSRSYHNKLEEKNIKMH